MEKIPVRLLGGELWSEMTMLQLDENNASLIKEIDYKVIQEICDLTMSVLARHFGEMITDDETFPVTPLVKKNSET